MANTRVRRTLARGRRTVRHHTQSVRSRIVVSILAVAALGLAASGVAAYLVQREGVVASIDARLLRTVPDLKAIASGATTGGDPTTGTGTDSAGGTGALATTGAAASTPLTSVDAILRVAMKQVIPAANESVLGLIDGKPALVPAANLPFRMDEDAAFVARILAEADPTQVVIGTATGTEQTLRYLIVPVSAAGDPSSGLYVAAFDLDAELGLVAESFQTFVRVALAALIVVGLVAWVVAGRLLRPIRLLRDAAAGSTNAADLTERIPVTGHDDVSELATAINGMFDRLQASSLSQRRLLDDIGHELKTPITIIRGHLELLDIANVGEVRATRELAIDELDRMSTLVSEISLLASSSGPNFVELAEVDIESLTAFVGAKASALDPARTWRTESANVLAQIDSRRITQAWLQLADNAVKYSTPGTPITILGEVAETPAGPCLNLSVQDAGPGIAVDAQEQIFERFRRLESSRGVYGSGLGLSIVSAIAEAHGGSVLLRSAPGTGSVFTISIPLVAEATIPEALVGAEA
ncbi:HAMP domain-containing histidine kinase [Cryobacterium sp. Sr8]|uniref:sensor histidine kinase n=1 Tax=Cryobacterium sp. Sr8 TaxID=1259203 RepID=UPI00106B696A|nr:HAMP domain-containing sensor histidine kinase [Cryobacterium sp. Sr8]TFD79374.1 HAMP domain-containing histidine kinase [Cryobacterium sp. Sr8]